MQLIETFPYLPRIEWESLDRAEFSDITVLGPLPPGTTHVQLRRSDDFTLIGSASGEFPDAEAFRSFRREMVEGVPSGTLSCGASIEHSDDDESARIDGAYIHRHATKITPGQGRYDLEFETALGVSSFRWQKKEAAAAWLTDWYLNGPRDFVWTRCSSRKGEVHYERKWNRHDDEQAKRFPGIQHEPLAFDHLHVESSLGSIMIHKVPDRFGPSWSQNIGIEYEKRADGTFPDDEIRRAIAELVSFVVGRRMMHVGSTTFDELGYPVAVMAQQPWGENVRAVCEMQALPPINVSQVRGGASAEQVLGALLPRYLELRTRLRLGDALWRLWLGNEAPLGIDLPIYSAGLDMLAAAWFKSSGSKSKGVYMPKADFDRLLADVFKAAAERLTGVEYGDRMVRRMKGSFQTSQREGTEWFFEEIGLPLGEHERAAMKARNAPAHGGDAGASQQEIDALIRHSSAYKTLFGRTILKLLGYAGEYIDRRSIGFPVRELHEPSGGG